MILIAGALLLTPGFITDTAGFICLIPSLRQRLILAVAARRPAPRPPGGGHPDRPGHGPRTLEGEYWRPDDRKRMIRPRPLTCSKPPLLLALASSEC